jgi:two-component system, chemotaxis family, protein-glutamate methylesterase/glutaminase
VIQLVVMGASAGGLDALTRVLAPLPRSFPLPIAIVQHRGIDDDGFAAWLRAEVALPVAEVEDKDAIQAGRIYLAPADYHLLVEPGRFALSVDERVHSARPAIDVLFNSASHAYRAHLLAVLLTGASTDGARGAAKVREHGGQVVVQDPEEAESKVMPRAAVQHAHRVFTLSEICRHLQVTAAARAAEAQVK